MTVNICGFLLFLLYQNVLAYDSTNCSNIPSSLPGIIFPSNPKMHFYLFTNKNFDFEQEIFTGNSNSLINSNFNRAWPVRILIHGWTKIGLSCLNAIVKDAYLYKGNFNVIIVDWWDWSQNIIYPFVTQLIFTKLAPLLADFTKFLHNQGNVPFDNMYLIGHSLGAHMAGGAGILIKPYQYNTIFGLDPAGLGYQGNNADQRLDKTQAKYVEQISTNMGVVSYEGIIGHSAFYPNYGRVQPYCLKYKILQVNCHHDFPYYYFAESIYTTTGFCAVPCPFEWSIEIGIGCSTEVQCNPKILMGGEPSIPKRGTFYLATNADMPLAKCNC